MLKTAKEQLIPVDFQRVPILSKNFCATEEEEYARIFS